MFTKLLVTGGRKFKDEDYVDEVLTKVRGQIQFDLLINGYAPGVDRICHAWAKNKGIQPISFEALWDAQGPKAGPIRNKMMYDVMLPDYLLAFPGGTGTNDMTKYVAGKKKQGHAVTLLFSEDFI